MSLSSHTGLLVSDESVLTVAQKMASLRSFLPREKANIETDRQIDELTL